MNIERRRKRKKLFSGCIKLCKLEQEKNLTDPDVNYMMLQKLILSNLYKKISRSRLERSMSWGTKHSVATARIIL